MNKCNLCKHLFEDSSVGHWECLKEDVMTDSEFEQIEDKGYVDNCPYFELYDDDGTMSIADMVKFTREVYGVTQREYALVIGTCQAAVSFMERGFLPDTKLRSNIVAYYEEARKKKYAPMA